jgi:hypothetical protein
MPSVPVYSPGGVPLGAVTDTHNGCVHSSRMRAVFDSRNASGKNPGALRRYVAGSRFAFGLFNT